MRSLASDLAKAETLSLPLTLLILVVAFGSLVAAGCLCCIGITVGDRPPSALVAIPSQVSPVDGNISVGDPADRARRRRRLLALLPPPRARGARRGRSKRRALDIAAATSGRAVLISGLTVIAAMAGMFLTGDKTFISFA